MTQGEQLSVGMRLTSGFTLGSPYFDHELAASIGLGFIIIMVRSIGNVSLSSGPQGAKIGHMKSMTTNFVVMGLTFWKCILLQKRLGYLDLN